MRKRHDCAAGEDVTSDSSLSGSRKAGAGHWLLKHKLSLDEGSSRDKAASDRKGGRLAQEEQSSKNSVTVSKSSRTGSSNA